jgi:PAS domain S-box-containing protein
VAALVLDSPLWGWLLAGGGLCLAVLGWVLFLWGRRHWLRSEATLARHREMSLDLICTASFDGYFVELNPAWTRVLGFELEELLTRPFSDFVHPDDLEATLAEVDKQARSGLLVFNFQNRYRCADGSYRWLEWTSRPDYEAGLMFAVARDVTARREAEEALARQQELLEETVARRTAELADARWETLRCLAMAAEHRDDQTFQHTQRVGRTAGLVAERLGLDGEQCLLMRHAAPLHDLGKLGIPDSILLKPGSLDRGEWEVVKGHAAAGAKILSVGKSRLLKLAAEIAVTHHEWWNGTGYPKGLAGDEIPLSGRIVAIADVFDALTHDRPYKPAWSVDDAVEEVRRFAGVQFDPAVVAAFVQLDAYQLAGRSPVDTWLDSPRNLRAVG